MVSGWKPTSLRRGTLAIVAKDGREIAESLNAQDKIPCSVKFKALVTTSDQILDACREANNDPACVGVITWMHTFLPPRCG
jgi:L-arabinose isomerase